MTSFFDLLLDNTLTRVVFFPTLACLPLLLFPAERQRAIKVYALIVSLVQLALTLWLVGPGLLAGGGFETLSDGPTSWIPRFGVNYEVVMDGISMPLVVLTGLFLPIVIAASWRGIDEHWKGYAASMLLLTTGILGALTAFDLFVFYIFWELMLIPMYLVIGIWGGERRIYAAVKFFLYTMAGSLLMLLGIVWMAWTYRSVTGEWSFAYSDFLRLELPVENQIWLFAAFALAFAIKVPVFPFHTWLPDAHVEAPTGGSVILAGVLLKLGTYGLLRFALPLFPHASSQAQPLAVGLALAGVMYGALVAWMQTDFKKLVAYSSVAHLGFVVLGIFAFDLLAWQGSLIQMINHGLSTGALFLLVGMIYERRHTKRFDELGGLAASMPIFAFFLVFSTLASVGLPGLNGFVGEFLILLGTYKAGLPIAAIIATFGIVFAAVYLFKMLHETLWGPIHKEENREVRDLSLREIAILIPLCVLMLMIGVAPARFLEPSEPALRQVLESYHERADAAPPAAPRVSDAAGAAGEERAR